MVLDHRSHTKYAQKNLDHQTGRICLPHWQTTSDSQSYSYDHVAFTVEFKETADSLDVSPECIVLIPLNCFQDSSNIVCGMQDIMAVDPRRRFTFGITVMGTSLGLWYANRSMLVGSQPLDITKVMSVCLLVFRL
jgi:hypothetical protein